MTLTGDRACLFGWGELSACHNPFIDPRNIFYVAIYVEVFGIFTKY
jgi:hypothetical protein